MKDVCLSYDDKYVSESLMNAYAPQVKHATSIEKPGCESIGITAPLHSESRKHLPGPIKDTNYSNDSMMAFAKDFAA